MKRILSLAEVIAIHKNEGIKFLERQFVGEVDIAIRDCNSGEVLQRISQKNMATRILPNSIQEGSAFPPWTARIFLSNDPRDMNEYKTCFKATYYDAMSATVTSLTRNATNRTWTLVGIVPSPSSGRKRDFWYVGFNNGRTETVVNTYGRTIKDVVAATKLTSMLTQNYGTQVDINYRLVFKRASDV